MRARHIASLLLASLGAACAGTAEQEQAPTADSVSVARARAAAGALGPDLMGLLLGTLERSGPEAALAVCADSAQLRTARHSTDGVVIRRIGTRVRNPLNTPDSTEARILAYLGVEHAAGRMPTEYQEVVRNDAGDGWELRYMRPILLQPPCTACHGAADDLAPGVRALIAARYPDDRAVGYAAGDLRGAISVRVPLPVTR